MFVPILIIFSLINYIINDVNNHNYPVVLWHGMGDTCCFPFSLGSVKHLLENELNGTYVKSLEIDRNIVSDYLSGFFIHPNKQIEYVCNELNKDEKLNDGYYAIGFSQGGQFFRAIAQKCPLPPMRILVTIGSQHQGIFGLPKCPSLKNKLCEYIRRLLKNMAYEEWIQSNLVQATYWHDPFHHKAYIANSTFLADINNEVFVNNLYAENLNRLEKFVMVKFSNDTIVQPKESQWFEFYKPGQDHEILPLTQSPVYKTLNLHQMDLDGRLVFLEVEGDHLQFSKDWFVNNIISIFKNSSRII